MSLNKQELLRCDLHGVQYIDACPHCQLEYDKCLSVFHNLVEVGIVEYKAKKETCGN